MFEYLSNDGALFLSSSTQKFNDEYLLFSTNILMNFNSQKLQLFFLVSNKTYKYPNILQVEIMKIFGKIPISK